MDEIDVKVARKNGDSTTISLTGFIELGKHYSIRKQDKFVILENIEDRLENMRDISNSLIASILNERNDSREK